MASATFCTFPHKQVWRVLAFCVAVTWRSIHAVQMSQPHSVQTVQSTRMDYEDENYVSLWDGGEVLAAEPTNEMQVPTVQSTVRYDRLTQAIGLFNTGTNLLERLLELNFPEIGRHTRFWKHSNLKYSWEFEDSSAKISEVQSISNYSAIAMIRNPFSWFASMLKAPYELQFCLGQNFKPKFTVRKDWLTHKCWMPCPTTARSPLIPASNESRQHCGNRHAKTLSSIVEVWNEWNRAYMAATQYGFDRILVIRYEDLVMHPTKVLARIAKYLKVPMPAMPKIPEDPAKTHGNPVDRDEALRKIRNSEFMASFETKDVFWACSRLDKILLERYGYASSCRGV
eukprot:TRINITY_DN1391_c0_g2_i5.p1 TRINITY_DN1391_c0_g2~~TRINITY_DN1391_c0_g2_i5.p1  ORF type:complete len:359 (-),score=17.34 TRINITY_DN1391_c0_g2_i5:205-1227(-)